MSIRHYLQHLTLRFDCKWTVHEALDNRVLQYILFDFFQFDAAFTRIARPKSSVH